MFQALEEVIRSVISPQSFSSEELPPDNAVLLHGLAGSGKGLLAEAAAGVSLS